MDKNFKLILISIAILILFTGTALADVTLTITSANNKTITVTNFDTNANIGTYNESEAIVLPYTNALITITTGNTFTLPTLKSALLSAKEKDVIMVFVVILLFIIALAILWM